MKYNLSSSEIIRVVTVQVFSNQTKAFRQNTVKKYDIFSRGQQHYRGEDIYAPVTWRAMLTGA
jgi:hypothetical protein